MIGSAQLRRGDAVLQHGSMQLEPDPDLFHQVFGIEVKPPGETIGRTQPQISDVINALLASARQWFGAEFVTQPLSDQEWQHVLKMGNG